MMAFTEARCDFTYSKMRGIVSVLAGFIKERKLGWNELIQRLILTSSLYPRPYFRTYLKIDGNHNEEAEGGFKANSLSLAEDSQVRPCDFDYLKVIGKGSFGKVLLARHKETSQYYAVKVLQKRIVLKKKEQKHIMAERSVLLKNLQHPFLVGLHYSFQTSDKLYFVLDYANGGELFCHLQRERVFLEPRARFYAAEIAGALGYLHSMHIIYRDLKPENILLDSQGHIMLTDFGLCKESLGHDDITFTFCGTPEYLAPEVLQKQAYDRTVDWWCLGAVLYEMLYGLPPFYSSNTDEMYNNILNKDPVLKPNVSNAGRALLETLLHKDRTQRMGARNDFMEVRSHAFFSPINWDDLMAKKTPPPFVPPLAGPTDLRHFDPEFTHLPVPGSLCNPDSSTVTSSLREAAVDQECVNTEDVRIPGPEYKLVYIIEN